MCASPNSGRIEALEPLSVWRFFAGFAKVPRASKHEQLICAHVKDIARQNGLAAREDRAGNLLIEVPASSGCEQAPVVLLQGHLDMVCEKNGNVQHDFAEDPIRMLIEQDSATKKEVVRADGTTLGADNGIGVAMALAAATSPDVVHGPLELLFTTDEEAGMSGAKALTPQSFRGRIMLNLDSEEDDAIYIGCAGGSDSVLQWKWPVTALQARHEQYQVTVTGLRGGHSGGDIHENRANAIKLLAKTLDSVPRPTLQLVRIAGGSKRNAIPREAQAVVAGPVASFDTLRAGAQRIQEEARTVHGDLNASIQVQRLEREAPRQGLSERDTEHVLSSLLELPNGVLGMSAAVPGLVETSNNVSIVRSQPQDGRLAVEVSTLSRSSSAPRLKETLDRIAAVAKENGAVVETGNDYPGWDPNPDSPVLALCRRVYRERFGDAPRVTAIHAGLECGLISDHIKGMDMVSFGPTIVGAHSPDERVFVASVQKSWHFLLAVLKALSVAG